MTRLIAALIVLLSMGAASRAAEPVLYVEDPALLAQLEKMGYAFTDIFGNGGDGNLQALYAEAPGYRALADIITGDVRELRGEIEAGGRPLREFTAAETGRVMDMRWLKTNVARFRLVGVVNRLDRRDFHQLLGEGGCGEVRLVYRLAYAFRKGGKGRLLSSRMPFNFNAVFDVKPDADGGCVGTALVPHAVQLQCGLRREAGRGWRLRRCRGTLVAGHRRERRRRLAGRRAARPRSAVVPAA